MNESTEQTCAICLDVLGGTSRRKLHSTECGHHFLKACFDQIRSSACLYCRKEVLPTVDLVRMLFEVKETNGLI